MTVLAETHRRTFDMIRLDLPSATRASTNGHAVRGILDRLDGRRISLGARHD